MPINTELAIATHLRLTARILPNTITLTIRPYISMFLRASRPSPPHYPHDSRLRPRIRATADDNSHESLLRCNFKIVPLVASPCLDVTQIYTRGESAHQARIESIPTYLACLLEPNVSSFASSSIAPTIDQNSNGALSLSI